MGVTVGATGLFNPFLIVGSVLTTVAAGMLTTLQIHSGSSVWIGYQAIGGIGLGLCLTTPIMVTQRISKPEDIAPATAVVLCKSQFLTHHVSKFLTVCAISLSITRRRYHRLCRPIHLPKRTHQRVAAHKSKP